ncbi:MAG: metal-dependent hydrolase [Chitinophagales bacterium]|nr:metal-dependent hydrolase [Bacteroidota bacterium]MBP7400051.1 metal-dependent hydrolase [Chitinophagales bacterium]MBK8488196.1 metal-dependent hydrolase [Bacteroidota bacterium]MBP8754418.1 metal-dependent hydrolase [Chitinophagales bacterium]MBP9190208.1 metal-dependent hydrolase [Chitinophagales bacterium]
MKIIYYGHSCFLVEISGKHLLFDPFITPNPLAKAIDINTINADFILLSHGHLDHVADVIAIQKNTNATIIGNFEVVTWFQKHGIENFHPMNIGGQWTFDFGVVKMVHAAHSSSMPDGSYGGNPGGFIITSKEATFYYAGDTALTQDMKLIGKNYKLDLAFLPVGDNFTMGYADAVIASKMIKCDTVIGMHYDTFGYIEIDHKKVKNKFKDEEINLHLIKIGETFNT